jgi:phenylpyruvate tautomerase PptA (4-oxalocrotonate tautomerase family)
MPSLSLTTNVPLSPTAGPELSAALSKILAAGLGKPESYVMVFVQNAAGCFGGSEEPAALVDIKSIGLPRDVNPVAEALTGAVHRHTHVPLRRIYITFTDVPAARWAHGGGTFA